MKAYWRNGGADILNSLTSALYEGEWSASRLGRFTPKERAPGIHWIGGWVGPRAVLDAVVNRKIPSPHRESNPRTPIVQPVAVWLIKDLEHFCYGGYDDPIRTVAWSKVVPVLLFLNGPPRHEGVLGEWRYSPAYSLTSALDGGEWSASRPVRFTPMDIAPFTHCIGGWVGDGEENNSQPLPGLEPPIIQPVAQRCTTEI
jgi:hypothetical protein